MSSAARVSHGGWPVRSSVLRRPGVARRALVALELVTGVTGLVGGVLLAAAPDGSLLRADPATLAGSPFSDWRVPGVLLAGLVGGGFLLAGWWQWRGHRYARELSMAAGAGLVCFEAAELAWLGFQPLEAVFAVVGVTVVILAWRIRRGHGHEESRRSLPRRGGGISLLTCGAKGTRTPDPPLANNRHHVPPAAPAGHCPPASQQGPLRLPTCCGTSALYNPLLGMSAFRLRRWPTGLIAARG